MDLSSKHLSRLCIFNVLWQGHPWVKDDFICFQPDPQQLHLLPFTFCIGKGSE